jgi:hypothetical protein
MTGLDLSFLTNFDEESDFFDFVNILQRKQISVKIYNGVGSFYE